MSKKKIKGVIDPFQDEPSEPSVDEHSSEFQKSIQKHVKKLNRVVKTLEHILWGSPVDVMWDEKKKVFCPHCKENITAAMNDLIPTTNRPVQAVVRVQAAKVWNELLMKKVVADKKEVASKGGPTFDPARAISEVAKRKEAEKKQALLAQGLGKN